MRQLLPLLLIAGILLVSGCLSGAATSTQEGEKATIYKSQSCGCCGNYANYVDNTGLDVNVVTTENINAIKQRFDIPNNMQSCHTMVIGDYFVEGHVPIEAVDKLMEEQPDIDGIALPDMPSGSPGMPGSKRETWTVYALKDGESSVFMTL